MIFTLEALEAKHGDALLLHYGEPDAPKLIMIDGGPAGVFRTLRGRLEELRSSRAPDGALPIRLLMVSHIDDDHINGVLALTDHLIEEKEAQRPLPYEISTLWHNAFEDVVGGAAAASAASVAEARDASADEALASLPVGREAELVLANVPQGRRLRDNARALSLNLNRPFGGLVAFPSEKSPVKLGAGLTFTVVGPSAERIEALRKDWEKKVASIPKEKLAAEAAAYVDDSVYNLSSIVVLAELEGKRMLLTGDARGDFILQGLEAAGLLDGDGKMHVDVLKLPHHGSEHNVEDEFFRRVTADHYVVSANGKYGNPDPPMLEMLTAARDGARYTIYLTNSVPHADKFLDSDSARRGYRVVRRAPAALSVRVELLDALRD
jgi:hypothetical protein